MKEVIADMEQEISTLKVEVDGIKLQLAERRLWFVKARGAERIKLQQIMDLQSGISTLKKQQKRKISLERNELIIKQFKKDLDPDVFMSIINEAVNND